jgi:hypothetical protein
MYTTIKSFYSTSSTSNYNRSSTTTVTLPPSSTPSFRQPASPTPPTSSSIHHDSIAKALVDKILLENDLYKVLGLNVNKFGVIIANGTKSKTRGGDKVTNDEIRRAYLERCRICHPE